jgi:hypothetical protein
VLWFLSLFMSLSCALAATLVQRWTRRYLADAQPRGPPRKRGPVHAYLRVGVERFGLAKAVDIIITLLHASVFFFVAGLAEFTFALDRIVVYTLYGAIAAGFLVYFTLTILPVFSPDCPYNTPLTPVVQFLKSTLLSVMAEVSRTIGEYTTDWQHPDAWWRWTQTLQKHALLNRRSALAACQSAYQRPEHVLSQVVQSLDENHERHQYLVGLPAFLAALVARGYNHRSGGLDALLEKYTWHIPVRRLLRSYTAEMGASSTRHDIEPLMHAALLTNKFALGSYANALIPATQGLTQAHDDLIVRDNVPQQYDTKWTGMFDWLELLNDGHPVVSFIAFCHLSATYALFFPTLHVSNYDTFETPGKPRQGFIMGRDHFYYRQRIDPLLLALQGSRSAHINLYRLLILIRFIMHYATLPENPVATHMPLWLPVLHGLHTHAIRSDLHLLPDAVRLIVCETLSVIGRDDLLPHPALGLPSTAARRNYATVFEQYPVLGGTLRSVVNAMGAPAPCKVLLHGAFGV